VDSKRFPHYHIVPRDLEANLRWRREVIQKAAEDEGFAKNLWEMCEEDPLFYINALVWTYNPKDNATHPKVPFITYEYQDEAIAKILTAIEKGYDVAWPKSRTMGASWMAITVFEYLWHFKADMSLLVVSRVQNLVDMKGNTDSLFWKIDFIHENQPAWLLPKRIERKLLMIENVDLKSVISGESTTANLGRGGRRTAILIDEFAAFGVNDGYEALKAVRDTTKCRVFNSTPQGSTNAFYEVVHKTSAEVYRMHWTKHPGYSAGLYTSEKVNGKWELRILDEEFRGVVDVRRADKALCGHYIYPEEYPFILDGKMRSPWYDNECARCVSPQEIAQELDIDFLGSSYQYFDAQFIGLLIQEYCMPPMLRGRLIYEPGTLEPICFELDEKGPLVLWFNVSGSGDRLRGREFFAGKRFAVGSDVSHGTGASNSVSSVVDLGTGKKVARWKDPFTLPERFCDETVALAKWFNSATMIWDASGPTGKRFTKRLIDGKYRKIYYRREENKIRKRISKEPGYFLNPEDTSVLLGDYREKLSDRTFINPSEEGMEECLRFIVQPGGKVEHSAAANSQDPTGAREAHGDEVIADALSSRLLAIRPKEIEQKPVKIPYMSMAWRLEQDRLMREESEREDW